MYENEKCFDQVSDVFQVQYKQLVISLYLSAPCWDLPNIDPEELYALQGGPLSLSNCLCLNTPLLARSGKQVCTTFM
jgi:hypothetical protein